MSGVNPQNNGLFVNFDQSKQYQASQPQHDLATTLAVGEEGGDDLATTLAVGEEGGDIGDVTTAALGEEGGEFTTLALGEEGGGFGDSIQLTDGFNAVQAADVNRDGQATRQELQQRDQFIAFEKFSNAQSQQQIEQFLPFIQSLNQFFGGFLTPIIQQLESQLNFLEAQESALNREDKANQFLQDHYGGIAGQDFHIRGNTQTISYDDLRITARHDGNPNDISEYDVVAPILFSVDPDMILEEAPPQDTV